MKKIIKIILPLLLIALVIIQFFHPDRNQQDATLALKNDISKVFPIPKNVHTILQTSCYDCHSNNTVYPWYASVQPIAWWLNHHVEEGKREINFNEFATYSPRRQFKKLKEISEQIKEGEMPLSSYTIIHSDAVLSSAQKDALTNWSTAMQDSMKTKYLADSLLLKKK